MANVLAFPPSMNDSLSVTPGEPMATCPGCHTVDATVTAAAVTAGEGWRCTQCTQHWDASRLAAVAAYAAWCEQRNKVEPNVLSSLDRPLAAPLTP